ncbi:ATP-dependent DNA helicase MER3 [Knufia fluminis]|uniref:ATP-dependent DNA helicase MER3 n=1 Tax=Knufia fluminis TaxID=191047 RepID=A0AAN8ISI6_9EURO|nr:ATP-dependent DNA helicase MER3 [Knufia fluminis]
MALFNPYAPKRTPSHPLQPNSPQKATQASYSRHFQQANTTPLKQQLRPSIQHEQDVPLDDFDRELLAQTTQGRQRPAEDRPGRTTIPQERQQGPPALHTNHFTLDTQLDPPKQLLRASSDSNPFSSPTVLMLENKQKIQQQGPAQGMRNAFNNRIAELQEQGNTLADGRGTRSLPRKTQGDHKTVPTVRGIQLVPTTKLPDKQRTLFKFPVFNAVQSRCFPTAYESDDNLVVSAPTGSGKTVIMELGILRLMDQLKSGKAKAVYQAPTKSLCSERYRDWQAKFGIFDLQCIEMTGDTDFNTLRNVASASIIITTPEKWDSVTRKWKDNAKLMTMIRLFMVDEVHILKDQRGATLEAIVSRMKSVGNDIRFIALSATIPNSEDIATWLTKNQQARHLPAIREVFDDSYRSVQLKKHILGHDGPYNPWAFEGALTEKMPEVVAKYSKGRPVMIFCPTKDSTQKTAEKLAESWFTGTRRA